MRIAVLLRGVNVGGVTVRSADLRDALTAAGLGDVRTVLASGNAIVDAPDAAAARDAAETALAERYGRRIRVHAVSIDGLASVVADYPFDEDSSSTPYVVFGLEPGILQRLAATATDEPLRIVGGVLCWANPVGTSTSSAFAKALARVGTDATTTRNLRTLRKVLAAA